MSTVNFKVIARQREGKKVKDQHAPIYVRYSAGRGMQFECKTPIMVLPKDWNQRTQRVKNTLTSSDIADIVNIKIVELSAKIMNEANLAVLEEKRINSIWLRDTVDQFFKQDRRTDKAPATNKDQYLVYLTDYIQWWIDNIQGSYLTKKQKPLSKNSKGSQGWALRKIQLFENIKKKRIRFSALSEKLQNEIVTFIRTEQQLSQGSLNILIKEFKFFVREAKRQGADLHREFPGRSFVANRNGETKERHVTLTWEEIAKINALDLSFNKDLDSIRDYFIIGLNTGMRISDFYLTLTEEHINDFAIFKTTIKTGTDFKVPIFDMVRDVLEKWNGLPPRKQEKDLGNMRARFNRNIREICRMAGITEEVVADHWDEKTGRKAYGKTPKWQAITSHVCRRSFATNMDRAGVAGEDIDAMCAWKSGQQRKQYTKTSLSERAARAKEVVDKHRGLRIAG